MTAFRGVLLLAAAALLPSCGRDHPKWIWVTVHNDGTASADVWSEVENVRATAVWEEHVDVTVSPNQSVKFGFRFEDTRHLKVRICRSSDQVILFNETWDRHELEHLDELVDITVRP